MRSSIVIDQAAADSCHSLSWPRRYGGLSMLVVMALLFCQPDRAFAQYPGFSSDAEPASVSADADDAPSGGGGNDAPANSGASSSAVAVADSAASSNRSGDDDLNSQTASNESGVAANRVKARQRRKHYFVHERRVEFAAMELVERRTGMVFSRHDVPRYLDELRAELATIRGSASAPLQSIALDVQHIDIELNKHIDKLLTMTGAPTTSASRVTYGFSKLDPRLPKTPDAAAAKMASISLKYELMDYGEKALQAMGAGYR